MVGAGEHREVGVLGEPLHELRRHGAPGARDGRPRVGGHDGQLLPRHVGNRPCAWRAEHRRGKLPCVAEGLVSLGSKAHGHCCHHCRMDFQLHRHARCCRRSNTPASSAHVFLRSVRDQLLWRPRKAKYHAWCVGSAYRPRSSGLYIHCPKRRPPSSAGGHISEPCAVPRRHPALRLSLRPPRVQSGRDHSPPRIPAIRWRMPHLGREPSAAPPSHSQPVGRVGPAKPTFVARRAGFLRPGRDPGRRDGRALLVLRLGCLRQFAQAATGAAAAVARQHDRCDADDTDTSDLHGLAGPREGLPGHVEAVLAHRRQRARPRRRPHRITLQEPSYTRSARSLMLSHDALV